MYTSVDQYVSIAGVNGYIPGPADFSIKFQAPQSQ